LLINVPSQLSVANCRDSTISQTQYGHKEGTNETDTSETKYT